MWHLPWHGRSAVTDLYPIMAAHRDEAPCAWPGSEKERAMHKVVVLLAVALMVGCVSESTYQQEV